METIYNNVSKAPHKFTNVPRQGQPPLRSIAAGTVPDEVKIVVALIIFIVIFLVINVGISTLCIDAGLV